MTPFNGDGKSIPIRCLIETVGAEQSFCGGSKETEKESFAIVPSSSLFKDVVKTVLLKLGYSSQDVANAKGAVQIKNWRPLDLDQVTDNTLVSVEDMLGDLTTVATLRIRITSGHSEDLKDKLLLLLIGQSHEFLQKKGCPITKEELEKMVAGHDLPTSAMQQAFYGWYNHIINTTVTGKQYDSAASGGVSHGCPNSVVNAAAPPSKTTRLRISFDSDEVSRLQKWFEQEPHPSRQQMTAYLNELNSLPARMAIKPLDLTNIMYWFKNARAAARRHGRSITSDDLSDDDERQSDREGSSLSAPPLPNSNAVYMIQDPLVENSQKEVGSIKESDESDMEEELSITDDEEERAADDAQNNNPSEISDKESNDASSRVKYEPGVVSSNSNSAKAASLTSSSSNMPSNFLSIASRLPGYPFPYGAIPNPMAYLQSQINPFYKDWSDKVQSAVVQAQANTAQQNLGLVKQRGDCELSKSERQKRHRAFIDPVSEIPKLEQWFTKDTHPSHYVIEQICDDLNRGEFRSRYPKLSPKNIQLWFKNHRAKVKRLRVGGGSLNLGFNSMSSPRMSPPASAVAISMMN